MTDARLHAVRLDRRGYVLDLDERFAGPDLDRDRWLPAYLPQWSSRERAAARFTLGPDGLTLRVDADQPPWAPEWDGDLRVSSLQTGVRSGPVGSTDGQHRFRPDLRVREAQPAWWGCTPLGGLIEISCAMPADPDAMGALWMIGLEDAPERSAELCVMELFGRDVEPANVRVGMGLHPFGNPRIRDDFAVVPLAIDARELHTYSAEWLPDRVRWYVDDVLVREADQAPDHPLQLMLSLYRFPRRADRPAPASDAPATFWVRSVRVWRPAGSETAAARGPR